VHALDGVVEPLRCPARRQVGKCPERVSDGNAINRDDFRGSEGATAVSANAGVLDRSRRAHGEFERLLRRTEFPELESGAVAQGRPWGTGNEGSRSLAVAIELWPANCIDPAVDPMELAARNAMLDPLRRESESEQLTVSEYSMLPRSGRKDLLPGWLTG
jgi:hypothetical protein